jgi:N-acetylneuraminate synthase/N,N'-diacetyllegionaminate synthase
MTESILFLVPARGGSTRVPGKNLRLIGGIPLVGWAVRNGLAAAARLPGQRHRIVCSTDDDAIADAASAWGATILRRPPELATAEATSAAVALHAIDALAAAGGPTTTLVLLQPTSPLLDATDLVAAIERHLASGRVPLTSVTIGHAIGSQYRSGPDDRLRPVPAGAAGDTRLAGAFYVVAPADLRASGRFVEPGRALGHRIAPQTAVDVDEESDLVAAEALLAARPVRAVPLGALQIGAGPVVVIAELGVNHDGDPAQAHILIDAAADAGADVVKFQTFDPAALAAAGAPTAPYQRREDGAAADQRAMLDRLALPADAWAGLQVHATERGLTFLSTPFDDASADLLDGLGVPAFKVGSGELTNTPFLARLARRGRPMLVSTGMADMVEVAAAVDAVGHAGNPPLALFHCVSSYPAAPEDANLRAIETLRRAFGVPVGWSDHTPGIELALASVAAGASIVEKHLTLDRTLPGPDHAASIQPDAFAAMVTGIRTVEAALGTGVKAPVPSEREIAAVARRSLHWAATLDPGTAIEEGHLTLLRPGTGIRPADLGSVIGRATVRRVEAGTAVEPDDLAAGG